MIAKQYGSLCGSERVILPTLQEVGVSGQCHLLEAMTFILGLPDTGPSHWPQAFQESFLLRGLCST